MATEGRGNDLVVAGGQGQWCSGCMGQVQQYNTCNDWLRGTGGQESTSRKSTEFPVHAGKPAHRENVNRKSRAIVHNYTTRNKGNCELSGKCSLFVGRVDIFYRKTVIYRSWTVI